MAGRTAAWGESTSAVAAIKLEDNMSDDDRKIREAISKLADAIELLCAELSRTSPQGPDMKEVRNLAIDAKSLV